MPGDCRRTCVRVLLYVALSGWLAPVPGVPLQARCLCCHVKLHAKFTGLLQHAKTSKHVHNFQQQSQKTADEQQMQETDTDPGFGCVAYSSWFLRLISFFVFLYTYVYFGPGKGAAYCDEYICWFVCLSTRISRKLKSGLYQIFICVLTVDMAQSSSDDTVTHNVLLLLWLTSCFHKYKMTYYVNS